MKRLLLGVIVVVYWLVAGLFAIRTPDWQTPDEPAHYNYIMQIAEDGRLPVVAMGDWDQEYQTQLTGSRFAPELLGDLDTVQYEDHQPPLYYLLATPVYALSDGNLTALRLFSVAIGTIIVVCAYGVGAVMFPDRPWIALGAAAFVAFQPMHVMFLASVNNDALGWSLVALTLLASVAYVKGGRVPEWLLGVLVGVGLITKATTYMMAGVALVAILLRWWTTSDDRQITVLARRLALYLAPALVFGLLWWVRNIDVYGFPDFLGLAAHDAVVIGQPRTAEMIDDRGFGGYLRRFIQTTFNSFWAQFGWMGVPLQERTYAMMRVVLVIVFAGIGVDMVRRRGDITAPEQRNAWILLALTTILAMLAYLYYNSEFLQHQGRYMFPLLIPLGIWLALGVDGWRSVIVSERLHRFAPYLTPLAFFALAAWDVWLLWRVIVPNLA